MAGPLARQYRPRVQRFARALSPGDALAQAKGGSMGGGRVTFRGKVRTQSGVKNLICVVDSKRGVWIADDSQSSQADNRCGPNTTLAGRSRTSFH